MNTASRLQSLTTLAAKVPKAPNSVLQEAAATIEHWDPHKDRVGGSSGWSAKLEKAVDS